MRGVGTAHLVLVSGVVLGAYEGHITDTLDPEDFDPADDSDEEERGAWAGVIEREGIDLDPEDPEDLHPELYAEEEYVRPEFREEDHVSAKAPSVVDRNVQNTMSTEELIKKLQESSTAQKTGKNMKPVVVVDVRDEERSGGHIQGSVHYPSSTFDNRVDELCKHVNNTEPSCVVFYCMRSQLKAPACCHQFSNVLWDTYGPSRITRTCVLQHGFVDFLGKSGARQGRDDKLVSDLDEMVWEMDIVDDRGRPVYYG